MDRPQLIRRLRITASAFFAVVTVALCVLWVRSCTWADIFNRQSASHWSMVSTRGAIVLSKRALSPNVQRLPRWKYRLTPREPGPLYHSYRTQGTTNGWRVIVPYWMPLTIAFGALLVTFPRSTLPTRFSLRTLLIATTIVAVVLGLGVWAAG